MYHSINYKYEKSPPKNHADENGPLHWSEMRFRYMIKLKEEAITAARKMWADYVWVGFPHTLTFSLFKMCSSEPYKILL